MPDFSNPEWLLLIPFVFGFAIWLTRGPHPALRFSDVSLLDDLPRGSSRLAPRISFVLRFMTLLLGTLALAGPRSPDFETRLPTEGIAIVFAVDISPSMETSSFDWNGEKISRIEAARRAFRLFVAGGTGPKGETFPGRSGANGSDAIGLVTFAIWPQTICPTTLDHRVLLQLIDNLKGRRILDTNTNIGDAIAEGLIRLEASPLKKKVLVLLTDGEHNFFQALPDRDPPLRPRQAAQLAANLGIPIYAIDTGGEPSANDPDAMAQRRDGREINRQIAEMTSGRFFTANDGAELLAVHHQIDELERQPMTSIVYRRYHEYAWWLITAAAAIAILALLFDLVIWRRWP